MGDRDINLLSSNTKPEVSEFFDILPLHLFLDTSLTRKIREKL